VAAGDPIVLGQGASSGALIPAPGSIIKTDEFGVQRGTLRYQLGDQSKAQSRPAVGSLYTGSMPQFSGFYVDAPGDIVGAEGKAAFIDVDYVRVDPLFVVIPRKLSELEIKQINVAGSDAFASTIGESLFTINIPIIHPIVQYKFSQLAPTSVLGTYSTTLPNAPTIGQTIFQLSNFNLTDSSIDIEEKTVTYNVTTLAIDPTTTPPTCVKSTAPQSTTIMGFFSQAALGLINPINYIFSPDPKGWLCIKDDNIPLAGGKLFAIEQQWKTQLVFSGTQKGTWWNDGTQICT
jgi:hypothetical protein